MTQIILEVDDRVGKIYSGFSDKSKKKFTEAISVMVKKVANDANLAEYFKLLDNTGNEAARNGLTPEILAELLASDD
jgi:hypothetical protein